MTTTEEQLVSEIKRLNEQLEQSRKPKETPRIDAREHNSVVCDLKAVSEGRGSLWAQQAASLPTSNVQTSIVRGRISAAVPA